MNHIVALAKSNEILEGRLCAGPPTTLLLRLGLGIFLALNIMVASWVPYSGTMWHSASAGVRRCSPLRRALRKRQPTLGPHSNPASASPPSTAAKPSLNEK